ncbi:TolC family protein [Panacibacter ginsenosidivorans]|uniref:TolC family protein n=1 Tax=Panacibacter ginsenosidivorans TaxID=1813871 RepID=A0A5B8VCH1_9BACT|nr:TolC family protein [Panacibacter ginsenosidivorans]QEC68641.1 TolC family protein [Panacibacter ginsenosidivorans]
MLKRFLGILLITVPASLFAQEKWDLRRLVGYAMINNISVKQADVQARIAALQLKQAKLNQWPTASFTGNVGEQFGRSIDPTTNQFTTTNFFFNQYQLQGGAQIYNWGRLKNAQAAADFNAKAALADIERAANDIALNVASYYLNVLASNEQIKINEVQIAQTKAQYDVTKKKVDAGALPELNLAELESQLATDSSNLITSRTNFEQNVLYLKALLNIDMAAPFDVATPAVESIPLEPIAELQPDLVYKLALTTQPQQKVNELRLKSAEKTIKSNRALMYPSISAFYSLGTTYNNQNFGLTGYTISNDTVGKVTIGGIDYGVVSPIYNPLYSKTKFFKQIDANFNQSVGIGLTIPIFNNGSYRLNYERSKLDLKNLQLQKEQSDQTLQSNIYNAYANAMASLQKYNAGIKSVASAQKAYDFASKRYEVGLLSTIDLLTNQNNLQRAKLQQVANQYDYVFKMKVLEFYKGQGIKL